ncbi:9525_t:CDS:2, partial [Ambispora leptoticha]
MDIDSEPTTRSQQANEHPPNAYQEENQIGQIIPTKYAEETIIIVNATKIYITNAESKDTTNLTAKKPNVTIVTNMDTLKHSVKKKTYGTKTRNKPVD